MKPLIGITTDIEEGFLKLKRQYSDSIEKAGGCPVLLPPCAYISFVASRIDALFIPGGDDLHPSYYKEGIDYEIKIVNKDKSDFELELFHEIIKLRKPVLGICYGMQLINVALGGTLYQDLKSQMPQALDHKKGWHKVVLEENPLIYKGDFDVNSSHHQAIKTLGKGLKAIALSEDKVIEAVVLEKYPFLLGVQWHPERENNDLALRIFEAFVEASFGNK